MSRNIQALLFISGAALAVACGSDGTDDDTPGQTGSGGTGLVRAKRKVVVATRPVARGEDQLRRAPVRAPEKEAPGKEAPRRGRRAAAAEERRRRQPAAARALMTAPEALIRSPRLPRRRASPSTRSSVRGTARCVTTPRPPVSAFTSMKAVSVTRARISARPSPMFGRALGRGSEGRLRPVQRGESLRARVP